MVRTLRDPLLTPTDLSIMVKIVNGIKFGTAVELIPQPKIGVSHKLVVVNASSNLHSMTDIFRKALGGKPTCCEKARVRCVESL